MIKKTNLTSFHQCRGGGNKDTEIENMSTRGRQAGETDSNIRNRECFQRISRDSQDQEKTGKSALEMRTKEAPKDKDAGTLVHPVHRRGSRAGLKGLRSTGSAPLALLAKSQENDLRIKQYFQDP